MVTGHNGPSADGQVSPDEKAASFREIAEAMTALGSYLETACHALEDQGGLETLVSRVLGILRKGLAQHDRASEALHRLRDNLDRAPQPSTQPFKSPDGRADPPL